MDEPVGEDPSGGLTPLERELLEKLAEVANLFGRVIGQEDTRHGDWAEAALHIHNLQHMVMAQSAARMYPNTYRLLGERLK